MLIGVIVLGQDREMCECDVPHACDVKPNNNEKDAGYYSEKIHRWTSKEYRKISTPQRIFLWWLPE